MYDYYSTAGMKVIEDKELTQNEVDILYNFVLFSDITKKLKEYLHISYDFTSRAELKFLMAHIKDIVSLYIYKYQSDELSINEGLKLAIDEFSENCYKREE